MYEITSSGLTHTSNFLGLGRAIVNSLTNKIWTDSPMILDFNFGIASVSSNGTDVIVNFEIRGLNGDIIKNKTLTVRKDMTYSLDNMRYSDMCLTLHSK